MSALLSKLFRISIDTNRWHRIGTGSRVRADSLFTRSLQSAELLAGNATPWLSAHLALCRHRLGTGKLHFICEQMIGNLSFWCKIRRVNRSNRCHLLANEKSVCSLFTSLWFAELPKSNMIRLKWALFVCLFIDSICYRKTDWANRQMIEVILSISFDCENRFLFAPAGVIRYWLVPHLIRNRSSAACVPPKEIRPKIPKTNTHALSGGPGSVTERTRRSLSQQVQKQIIINSYSLSYHNELRLKAPPVVEGRRTRCPSSSWSQSNDDNKQKNNNRKVKWCR